MNFSQMPDSPSAVFAIVLEVALKGTLLLVVAAMAAFILRRATASLRHLLWSFALIAMLAIPAFTLVLPRWNLGIVPVPNRELVADRTRGPSDMTDRLGRLGPLAPMGPMTSTVSVDPGAGTSSTVAPSVTSNTSSLPPDDGSLANSLALLWIGGVCAGLITIVGGSLTLRRLAANARELDSGDWLRLRDEITLGLGITRDVRILQSDSAAMPATWGFVRPVVLLPSDSAEWTEERRRVVLVHELAHVSRNDFLMQLIAQVCCAVYWFHPAVWYTARRLRAERELACDEHVLELGVNACDYAAHLLEIARVFRAPVGSGITAVAMARPSQLEGRVLAILDGNSGSRGHASRKARIAALTGLAIISVPLAAMQPWSNDAALEMNSGLESSSAVVQSASDGTDAGDGSGFGEGEGDGEADPRVWSGNVPAGKWVEIIADYGDIRAELSSSGQVEVYAVQKNGNPMSIRLHKADTKSGVTLCPVRGEDASGGQGCDVDQSGRLKSGIRSIRVDFLVKVPAGVGIAAHTGRGNVAAENLRSYVWGTSDKGDISITTTDLAEASTRTGSISAEFGRRSWKQNLEFLTETGNVTVVAPSDANMVVEAWTKYGVVQSEFPGRIRPFESGQRTFTTVGRGGGALTLQSGNGTVAVKRGGRAAGETSALEAAMYSDAPSTRVDPKPNPNPDPDYDPDPNPNPYVDYNPNPDSEVNPDPNVNPHVEWTDDDPTGERVDVTIPKDMLSRLSPDRMRNAPDAKAIERLRAIAVTHVRQHGADLVRERSLWALSLVRDGRIVEPLMQAMSSSDWKVRAYAAWGLSEANDPRGSDKLITALGDQHWRVRMHAAGGLQRLGGPAAVAPLIKALSDNYWQVRITAVDALARIGDRRAIAALNHVANNDPREMVRGEAEHALERLR